METRVAAGRLTPRTQKAASRCYFTLTSSSATFPTSGGSGSFEVVLPAKLCLDCKRGPALCHHHLWKFRQRSGIVKYAVAANTGDGKTATITVGNQAGSFQTYSVNQASANVCAFSLSPSSVNISNEAAATPLT